MLKLRGVIFAIVPLTLIATTGLEDEDQGLASGLFNTSQQVGGALGLAILSTVAAARWDLDCAVDTAVAWNPSLRGGAKIEETYLVGNDGFELITDSGEWATSTDGGVRHSQVKVVQ